jgi:hypothetical protein
VGVSMDRLSTGDKLVAGGGIVLLILSFLKPWAEFDTGELGGLAGVGDLEGSGWSEFYGFFPLKLGFILAIVAIGWVIAKAAGAELPQLPPIAYVGVSGGVLLLIVLTILIGPAGSGIQFGDAGIERGLWLWVSVIPAAAMAWGGYLQMQEASGGAPMTYGGTPSPPPPPPTA